MEQDAVVAWRASRAALAEEVARVVALLRETPHPPPRPADQTWGFADTAAHLSHAWMTLPPLSQGDVQPIVELVGQTAITHPSEMSALTEGAVARDPERDPTVLADRIEAAASAYLASCDDADIDLANQWIAIGVMAPMPMFTAHLLNETVLHGLDLARAAGRPWVIDPVHAEMALRGFLVPVIGAMQERLCHPSAANVDRTVVEFRMRGAGRLRIRLEDGSLHVDEPAAGGRVDAHIGTDPATLLTFLWGRLSLAKAVLRGRMVMWGWAPWRAFAVKRAIALP